MVSSIPQCHVLSRCTFLLIINCFVFVVLFLVHVLSEAILFSPHCPEFLAAPPHGLVWPLGHDCSSI